MTNYERSPINSSFLFLSSSSSSSIRPILGNETTQTSQVDYWKLPSRNMARGTETIRRQFKDDVDTMFKFKAGSATSFSRRTESSKMVSIYTVNTRNTRPCREFCLCLCLHPPEIISHGEFIAIKWEITNPSLSWQNYTQQEKTVDHNLYLFSMIWSDPNSPVTALTDLLRFYTDALNLRLAYIYSSSYPPSCAVYFRVKSWNSDFKDLSSSSFCYSSEETVFDSAPLFVPFQNWQLQQFTV